jgi:hypothetical protein
LQAIEALADQIGALIGWQSHSNAWSRQIESPSMCSASASNPVGANFCEMWNHS